MLESVFAELLALISEYFASVSCNKYTSVSLSFVGFQHVQNTGLKECVVFPGLVRYFQFLWLPFVVSWFHGLLQLSSSFFIKCSLLIAIPFH